MSKRTLTGLSLAVLIGLSVLLAGTEVMAVSFPDGFTTKQTGIVRTVSVVRGTIGEFPVINGDGFADAEFAYRVELADPNPGLNYELKQIEILVPIGVDLSNIETKVVKSDGTLFSTASAVVPGVQFNTLQWTSLPTKAVSPTFTVSVKFLNYKPLADVTSMTLRPMTGTTYATGSILGPMSPPPPITGSTSYEVGTDSSGNPRTDVFLNDALAFVCSGYPPFVPDPAGDERCKRAVDGSRHPLFSCIPTSALPAGHTNCDGPGNSGYCFTRSVDEGLSIKCDVVEYMSKETSENSGSGTCTTTKQPIKSLSGKYTYVYTVTCTP